MPDQLDRALREDGFVQLTCPAFDWSLANTVFDEAHGFLIKIWRLSRRLLIEVRPKTYGYQGFGDEALDPSSGAADRKETFTMRGLLEPRRIAPGPQKLFRKRWSAFTRLASTWLKT